MSDDNEGLWYQCRLRRGDDHTVAWIPERAAKVGASIELKTAGGEFWEVATVGDKPIPYAQLRDKQERDRDFGPSIIGN